MPRTVFVVLVALTGCETQGSGATSLDPSASHGGEGASGVNSGASEPLIGVVARDAIESALPSWRAAREAATPDPAAARALASVPPGAEVAVYLGTWCGDSRREVARLWSALDLATSGTPGRALPFALRHIGVDRAKQAPGGLLDGVALRYVPTIIVRRGGRELGRVVESSPNGIERDLLSLLTGQQTGVLSNRTDLGTTAAP